MADEACRLAMEAADGTKEEATEVMPRTISDPSETGGVEAIKTGKGNPPWNAGTVERKATGRASARKSTPIQIEPGSGLDPDTPTKQIGSVRTTPKDPEKPEKGLPS